MSIDAEVAWLLAGLAAVLSAATLVGRLLQARVSARSNGGESPGSALSPATVRNLNQRIGAWWVLAIVAGLALLAGKAGLVTLFAVASFLALREFVTLAYTRRGDHWALIASFFVIAPIQYALVWVEWYGLFAIFIPVYAFALLPVASVIRGDTQRFLERAAKVQWGLMLCVYCLSYVPALVTLEIPGYGGREVLLAAFLLLVVQASDVLQYICGKLVGRTPVAPAVSPSKTLEGTLGGIALATALGAALAGLTPFAAWQAGALALAAALAGFAGGLVMSAIKRDCGVKDWGELIEGHGGVLDRLDSLVFSAPVFFHIVRYFWT
ncbi:MAG: phosphatidate cytidylyltransferase [Rhodovibrionaceae bacterium]|nr:phosphatidate cytidylyltransferase [Rhodovibrionaceae bacterium]